MYSTAVVGDSHKYERKIAVTEGMLQSMLQFPHLPEDVTPDISATVVSTLGP
jgi:hypothetical protein